MISYNEVVCLSVPVLSILFELLFVSPIPLIDGCVTSILAALPRLMVLLGSHLSVHEGFIGCYSGGRVWC